MDLRDKAALARLFARHRFQAVIHFAALKAVGESCERPLDYFDNNICGTINLLQAMQDAGVRRLVFSSSATVYGDPEQVPVDEDARLDVTNPTAAPSWSWSNSSATCAVAARRSAPQTCATSTRSARIPSGLIGEDPSGVPNNLMPYICQVAAGRRSRLSIFGGDYPTRDGTGVRDYIHVIDLAQAHVDALDYLTRAEGNLTVNLGTGRGVSVLELVHAFEEASGRGIPYEIVARRPGDVAQVYADPSLASGLLGWRTRHDVAAMCRDAWRWQSMNPDGYGTTSLPRPSVLRGLHGSVHPQ